MKAVIFAGLPLLQKSFHRSDPLFELIEPPNRFIEVELGSVLTQLQILQGPIFHLAICLQGVHDEADQGVGLVLKALYPGKQRQGVQGESSLRSLVGTMVQVVADLHYQRKDVGQPLGVDHTGQALIQQIHVLGHLPEFRFKHVPREAALRAALEVRHLHELKQKLLCTAPGQHRGVVVRFEVHELLQLLALRVEVDDLPQVIHIHDLVIQVQNSALDV
mmetsp:Transcript_88040/g.210345  ORF Transcript_88040/g.210345 Transcript_88040/m.210345 type:complete len:219 (+) Transcript_88040:1370-2026(+)